MRFKVRKSDRGLSGSDVDPNYSDTLLVKVQERWPSPARSAPIGAFGHPSIRDELFNDQRDRAALKAGMARKICA